MSQDLFAAFGGPVEASNTATAGTSTRNGPNVPSKPLNFDGLTSIWDDPQQQQNTIADSDNWAEDDDDDDFGDFENAPTTVAPVQVVKSTATVLSQPKSPELPHRKTKPFSPKVPPKQEPKRAGPRPEERQEKIGHHPFAGHMDLLFETGDEDYDAGTDELGDLATNPEAAMAYSKRLIAEQEAALASKKEVLGSKPPVPPKHDIKPPYGTPTSRGKSDHAPVKDPNVLFDADNVSESDDEQEDDWGDFEAGNESSAAPTSDSRTQPKQNMPAIDLLGLNDDVPYDVTNVGEAKTVHPKVPSRERYAFKQTTASPLPSVGLSPTEDAWDDFEEVAPVQTSPASTTSPRNESRPIPPKPRNESSISNSLPPTNIPPPIMLLSLFPSLFAAADDALFSQLGRLDLKQRQMLLAHPASHQFLKGYLDHCTVLARIVAGRKFRWKRDHRLSQSMRIGPAAAGGKGGMKLAGVDKSEVAKEDREVLDAVRLWKAQVGKVRSAVTAAASSTASMPSVARLPLVPDIAEQMPVKALKPAEGGIVAPHACALCGLKREERVAKVDGEVEDSFGEWWIQGMNMHVSCKEFWDQFSGKLRSR